MRFLDALRRHRNALLSYCVYKIEAVSIESWWCGPGRWLFLFECLMKGVSILGKITVIGKLRIRCFPGARLVIGHNFKSICHSRLSLASYSPNNRVSCLLPSAEVIIGQNVEVNGINIVCRSTRVVVGNDVKIACGCTILDSDFHGVGLSERHLPMIEQDREVVVGDNVWIGLDVLILKGSRIGENTVVGAGSIVRGTLEANCVYAGNPAQKVRSLK